MAHAISVAGKVLNGTDLDHARAVVSEIISPHTVRAERGAPPAELRHGDPEELRVGAAALPYGFSHHGRFSAAYQRRFGERPSTTLRRRHGWT